MFTSPDLVLIDKWSMIKASEQFGLVMDIFTYVIASMIFILTFFLLLVAFSQNTKDNIWEYGVMRSMGVTKQEGKRIFMYEASCLMAGAILLGVINGTIVSRCAAYLFYMMAELPLY